MSWSSGFLRLEQFAFVELQPNALQPNAPLVCEKRREHVSLELQPNALQPNAPLVCEQRRLPSIEA